MSRLPAFVFAVLGASLAMAADSSTECQGTECQDETSLVQVKASIKRSADDAQSKSPAHFPDVSLFFKNKQDLLAGFKDSMAFEDAGEFAESAGCDSPGCPCIGDIVDQWKTESGKGYTCCKKLGKADLLKQPLCGLCIRAAADALAGEKGSGKNDCDASRFAECAKVYCQAQSGSASDALLKKIAKQCVPVTPTATGMLGIVANNPKKSALETFLTGEKATIAAIANGKNGHNITGTASSSSLAVSVTKATKAGFNTESGPWGGDAQLAGLLAAQKTNPAKKYIDSVIFFKDPKEAHHEDILALVAVMKATLPAANYAFDAKKAKDVLALYATSN
jgi:methylglyoxal synthase